MSQTDIDTITGIVTAVSEDTEPVSKETKKTVADLFAKYKMTDKDINFFKTVGPGFIWVTHDVFFFTDALESLKTGKPIKSEALQYVEELGLSYKSITPEQIAISDREIENISKNAPALNPPAVMTENDIKSFLNYAKVRAVRVDELFSK
jgi:uncharacterized membrane protein YvbJ